MTCSPPYSLLTSHSGGCLPTRVLLSPGLSVRTTRTRSTLSQGSTEITTRDSACFILGERLKNRRLKPAYQYVWREYIKNRPWLLLQRPPPPPPPPSLQFSLSLSLAFTDGPIHSTTNPTYQTNLKQILRQ